MNAPTHQPPTTPISRGFTLIELLLGIVTSAIILIVISSFLGQLLSARVKNQAIAEVEHTGARILSVIDQSMRNATAITTPTDGTSASSLSLTVLDAALSPTVFDTASSTLHISQGGQPPITLSSSRVQISGFSVSNLSRPNTSGNARIQFTLSHLNPSNRPEYTYAKTFFTTASLRQ